MFRRIFQIVRKETIQIRRDTALLRMLVFMPVLQLLIYGYVVATEIRDLSIAVLDHSKSTESRQLVERFLAGGYFMLDGYVDNLADITQRLNKGDAVMGIVIPPDFGANVRVGTKARVQLLVDGVNSNTATIAMGYAAGVVAAESERLIQNNFELLGFRLIEAGVRQEERVWFNPALRAINYMVPGIICMLLVELMIPMVAASIVKEREHGTIEQLMVTPLRAWEFVAGKTIPYIALGFLDMSLVLLVGTLWFRVPVVGSLLSLFGFVGIFLIAILGFGVLISTFVSTLQQTALMAQIVIVPNVLLSGFMFPIESMPWAMQQFTYILPLRYFLIMIRGVMMKGIGLPELWDQTLALLILGSIVFTISWVRFRKIFG